MQLVQKKGKNPNVGIVPIDELGPIRFVKKESMIHKAAMALQLLSGSKSEKKSNKLRVNANEEKKHAGLERNEIIIERIGSGAFVSRICDFCNRGIQSNNYCTKQIPTGKYALVDEPHTAICGKAMCVICRES